MRLRLSTDLGLRAPMRLTGEPELVFSTNEMVREPGISRNHLTEVARTFAGGRTIVTRWGTGGGFALARAAEDITLDEVLRLLESDRVLGECCRPEGGAAP